MVLGYTVNSDLSGADGIFSNWQNLYIHIPFCVSKCGYCAFYSETQSSLNRRHQYLDALLERLRKYRFSAPLASVYIGGGTPNFLTVPELEKLFTGICSIVPLADDCEISCELNPECLTADKLALLKNFATRLSLGVQSFDAEVRRILMRQCSQARLLETLSMLQKEWTGHFNIDLIYGVSSVPWQVFENDLQTALSYGVDHLSCYALTAEENSRLGLQSPLAADRDAAEWWLRIGEFLQAYDIHRYEISNYARENCCCQHNVNVWLGGTLLGIGAGAAGFDGKDRYTEIADIDAFIAGEGAEIDRISPILRMLEIFAVNLRTSRGWMKSDWEKLYSGSWHYLHELCAGQAGAEPEKWIVERDHIALSKQGLLFWDDVAMEILDWEIRLKDEIFKI